MSQVGDFIAAEMSKPFEPGLTDCGSTVDRWVTERLGWSPFERFGRQVGDERGMDSWLSQKGGLLSAAFDVTRGIASVEREGVPQPGDVGLIIVEKKVCLAIRGDELWWSRDHDGFITCDDSHAYRTWVVD